MIDFIITQEQARVPVTVFRIRGNMDGSTYREVIAKAQEIWAAGARYILIDLSEVPFLSSAGVVALHTILRLVRGQALPETDHGWEALRAMERDRDTGPQKNVKLLNPQAKVSNVLEMVGFVQFFEVHYDFEKALASF